MSEIVPKRIAEGIAKQTAKPNTMPRMYANVSRSDSPLKPLGPSSRLPLVSFCTREHFKFGSVRDRLEGLTSMNDRMS